MDSDNESSEDEECELQNINIINAILDTDKTSAPPADSASQCSASTAASSNSITNQECKIEIALALNKLHEEKLRRLENVLVSKLAECRNRLREVQGLSNLTDTIPEKQEFLFIHCGKPYFKDYTFFPAPENNDTILMKRLGIFDIANVASVPGWTVKDKREFIAVLLKLSQSIEKTKLHSLIAQYHREAKANNTKNHPEMVKKFKAARQEIVALDKKPLSELAIPINVEYDWEHIANMLGSRHSPEEYQALWKLFLHPSINKETWSKEEHFKLQSIANCNNRQDWDEIAKLLDTGRTGYQCFVYYRTNMSNSFTGKKWSTDEEEFLKRLVEYYRQDNHIPWAKIASKMPNRTKLQIYNKYIRSNEKRGRFLPEEDSVLLTYVEKYGEDFKKISKVLNGRSTQQLRNRYVTLLKCKRVSAVWTLEEDRQLLQLMANQDSGVNYADLVKYFKGKDRANIRTRYTTLTKWMKRFPKKDIEFAPRRGARRLTHGRVAPDLSDALDTLKKRMETDFQVPTTTKRNVVTMDSTEEEIEDAIIVALINENIRDENETPEQYVFKELSGNHLVPTDNNASINLRKLLILLRANLNETKFKSKSIHGEKFPALLVKESALNTTRSYSKKKTTTNEVVNQPPDIWGKKLLGPTEYFMPPNLSNILGCKQLMSFVKGNVKDKAINRDYIIPRKGESLPYWNTFMDRFLFLFLWPMLLSNTQPMKDSHYIQARLASSSTVNNLEPIFTECLTRAPLVLPNYPEFRQNVKVLASKADVKKPPSDEDTILAKDEYILNKPFSGI